MNRAILILILLGYAINLCSQVQFSVVCNQQTYTLEVVVSGKEKSYHKILKDRLPNQAAAQTYLQENAATLSCDDPNKAPVRQPAANPNVPPPTTAINTPSSSKSSGPNLPDLKSKSTKIGIITFQPNYLDIYGSYDITETKIPTIYFAGGREVAKNFGLNFEMLFNYRRFDIKNSQSGYDYNTTTQSFVLAGGIQGQYHILLPVKGVVPYPQASVGYLHNILTNEETSIGFEDTYDYNYGMFYWKLGAGVQLEVSNNFGFFLEIGQMWARSIKTLGQITETILEDRGVENPQFVIPSSPPFSESVENDNTYFKVGMVFKSFFR